MFDLALNNQKGENGYAVFVPALNRLTTNSVDDPKPSGNYPASIAKPDDCNYLSGNGFYFYDWGLFSAGDYIGKPSKFQTDRKAGTQVICDSGGYQIIGWRKSWDVDYTQVNKSDSEAFALRSLQWQQSVADVAITLDVPTGCIGKEIKKGVVHPYKDFKTCLDATQFYHSVYSANHDPSKATRFLNVLQGNSEQERDSWYDAVKGHQYCNGWSISFRAYERKFYNVAQMILRLHYDGVLGDHLHVLGTGSLRSALGLTLIQRAIRKQANPNFTITFDCSTPVTLAKDGWILGDLQFVRATSTEDELDDVNDDELKGFARKHRRAIGTVSCQSLVVPKVPVGELLTYKNWEEMPFPFMSSPIGFETTMDQIFQDKKANKKLGTIGYRMISLHNVFTFIKAIQQGNRLLDIFLRDPANANFQLPLQYQHISESLENVFSASNFEKGQAILAQNKNIMQFMDVTKIWGQQDLAQVIKGREIQMENQPMYDAMGLRDALAGKLDAPDLETECLDEQELYYGAEYSADD